MTDIIRIIVMVLMVAVAMFIGFMPLVRHLSKTFNITSHDAFNMVILTFQFLAILIMVITISVNYQSSIDQIKAIKNATQDHINKIEEFNRRSKSALVSALILEHKENLRIIKEILSHEREYIDESSEGKVALNKFSFEAYHANLNNATIDDSVLLDKIVQVYSSLKLWQSFLDSAMLPNLTRISAAGFLKNAIIQMRDNLDTIARIEQEIIEYRSTYYE